MAAAADRVVIQQAPFDFGAECGRFVEGRTDTGAVVTFCGVVRDDGGLHRMEIEHYPGMTATAIARMVAHARTRWTLTDALVIHRYGTLHPGERIMMVATAAPHRADAFAAAEYLMDYLKSRAPFWKKEHAQEGPRWVAPRTEDEDALSRW